MDNHSLVILKNRIKKNYKQAVKEAADFINEEIVRAYTYAIDAFYDDYEPEYYNRTYSTYEAMDKYHFSVNDKYSATQTSNGYIAGITVNTAYMTNSHPYQAETDWVFDRTFNKGIHGVTSADQRAWGRDRIEKFQVTDYKRWGGKRQSKDDTSMIHVFTPEKVKLNWYKKYRGINYDRKKKFRGKTYHTNLDPTASINNFYNTMKKMKGSPSKMVNKAYKYWKAHPKRVQDLIDSYLLKIDYEMFRR